MQIQSLDFSPLTRTPFYRRPDWNFTPGTRDFKKSGRFVVVQTGVLRLKIPDQIQVLFLSIDLHILY